MADENPYAQFVSADNPYAQFVDKQPEPEQDWRAIKGIGALFPAEVTETGKGEGVLGTDRKYRWSIPPVIKDAYNTAVEAGEAFEGKRDLTPELGLNMALLAAGVGRPAIASAKYMGTAPSLAKETVPAVKEVVDTAGDAIRASKPMKAIESQQSRAMSRGNYNILENSNVRVSPESFQEFADKLPGQLNAYSSKHPGLTPKATQVLSDFKNFATDDADTLSLSEIERSRQAINKSASGTRDAHDAAVLGDINDKLEEYVDNLKDEHLDAGDISDLNEAQAAKIKARELWKRNAQTRRIEDVKNIAENQDNPDLYIRQRFTSFTRNPRVMGQYTPKQQASIVKIANQGTLGQLGRIAPHLTPAGMVKGAVLGGAATVIGAPAAATLAGVSTGAFHGAQALRGARVNDLLTDVSRGGNSPGFFERLQAERAIRKSVQDMDAP